MSSPQRNPSLEAAFGREDPGGGFFQRCLAKNRGSTPAQQRLWRNGIYDQIREVMSSQGSLSIERMCQMVPVSRRGFYRSLKEQQPVEEELEVRSAIQQIALEHRRRYGYRRITAELHRRGMQVNHKRVVRIMREDNLLGLQPRRFKVTTDSSHKVRGISELSCSDEAERDQSAVGSGHHLHSAEGGICLLGGDPRWVLSQSGGLGSGSDTSGTPHHRGAGASHRAPTARTRPGASLGSGVSIRSRGIYSHPREVPHGSEHESAGKPVRQCQLRKLHEDAEAGRNLRQQVR